MKNILSKMLNLNYEQVLNVYRNSITIVSKTILVLLFILNSSSFLKSQDLSSPVSIDIPSNQARPYSMNPHLNGVGRNHSVGFTTAYDDCGHTAGSKDWYENRLEDKIEMFGSIQNSFADNGNRLYRFGHNISDGNANWEFSSFAITSPGWHWATDYLRGADDEFFRVAQAGNLRASQLPDGVLGSQISSPTSEIKFGAGVHRFFYTYRCDNGDPYEITPDKFSGFTVNVNYDYGTNGLKLTQNCPKSYSVTLPSNVTQYPLDLSNLDMPEVNQADATFAQIGGPTNGDMLLEGSYEINYRFDSKQNPEEVVFCGFTVSVNCNTEDFEDNCIDPNNPSNSFVVEDYKIVRLQEDVYTTISVPPNLNTSDANAVLEAHQKNVTITHPMVIHSIAGVTNTDFEQYNENDTYQNPPNDLLNHSSSWLALQTKLVAYDNLCYLLQEASDMEADLSIVLNIGTGSPYEAKGLAQYLQALGTDVAYYELGSELMGGWNKSSVYFGRSPEGVGRATRPYAKAIKDFNPETKIATTSSYDFIFTFDISGNPGVTNISARIKTWLDNLLDDNGELLVDYLNLHNYMDFATRARPFNGLKVRDILAINELLEKKILPEVADSGYDIPIILSESNTGDVFHPSPTERVHLTMSEAMYYAESFRLGAAQKFKSYTPFALVKNIFPFKDDNVVDPPSSPVAFLKDSEDFDILFYGNNGQAHWWQDVYVKPTFKVKKVLAENLGNEVIAASISNMPTYISRNSAFNYTSEEIDQLGILSTRKTDVDGDTYYIMITNRALPKSDKTRVQLKLDGQDIVNAEIISLVGKEINDKNPVPSLRMGQSSPLYSQDFPEFVPTNVFSGGEIEIEPFSVNIVKISTEKQTLPTQCTAITNPLDGDDGLSTNFTIEWQDVSNVSGYHLYVGEAGSPNYNVVDDNTIGAGINSYTLSPANTMTDILPCTEYKIRVVPIDLDGNELQDCPLDIFVRTTCCGDCATIEINSDFTWPGSYSSSGIGQLTVKSGNTLEIPSGELLEFCRNGQLIVEPNAKVELYGTLSACDDYWQGVRLHNITTYTQTPPVAEFLSYAGSIIEKAFIGLDIKDGFVNCNSTQFLNNRISILSKSNQPWWFQNSFNQFVDCHFELNDDYTYPTKPFYAHAVLENATRKYNFLDCKFLMAKSVTQIPRRNYGIKSVASSYYVLGDQTKFDSHTYGVHNTNLSNLYPPNTAPNLLSLEQVMVSEATFDHCAVGIFDRTSATNVWVGNTFFFGEIPFEYLDLYPNPIDAKTQIGIAAESGVYGFTLEKNNFIGPPSYTHPTINTTNNLVNTNRTIGTNMVNLGDVDNFIRNNLYENLKTGNQALGLNGKVDDQGNLDLSAVGLLYTCNHFIENNEYDILGEIHQDRFGLTEAVLNLEQGPKDPFTFKFQNAGNCFSEDNVFSHFTFHRTDGKTINYYHPSPNKPVTCLEIPTKISGVVLRIAESETPNTCPDRPTPLPETPSEGYPDIEGLGILPWTEELSLQNNAALANAEMYYENAENAFQKALWQSEVEKLATIQLLADQGESYQNDLERIGHVYAQLSLAERHFASGDLDNAIAILSAVENIPNNWTSSLQEIQTVWGIIASTGNELDESQLEVLEEIAEHEMNLSSAYARNYLTEMGHHFPPILSHTTIEVGERSLNKGKSSEIKDETSANFVKLYPNPTDGLLNLVFSDELKEVAKEVGVFSVQGTLLHSFTIEQGITNTNENFDNLAPGFYYLIIKPDGHKSFQVSFIVSK